ncbi:MAG: NAD(+) synthase, partial [Candidatus Binataceae bacterium]
MRQGENFFNFYNHDFVRVAVAIPAVRVADPGFNAAQTIALMREAAARQAILALFPELGISAYSCDDLFHQRPLLDGCRDALAAIVEASAALPLITLVGTPLEVDSLLFNCAVVIARGRILGVVPKSYLPNYREFYEARQFTAADGAISDTITLCGQRDIPFGPRLLFQHEEQPRLTLHIEICEDLWVPIPPSSLAALAGATVLLNLSASNVTIGKAGYRRELVASQSARCLAAYLYSAAGPGESTTDLAWDGHALICENGNVLGESARFNDAPQLVCVELDLERLAQERMRQTTFGQARQREHRALREFRKITFSAPLPRKEPLLLDRHYERFPYVPSDATGRDERCAEVYEIQVQGLVSRLRATALERVVIGISGGIDSTQALLV